jgi:hypothetical protein
VAMMPALSWRATVLGRRSGHAATNLFRFCAVHPDQE